MQKIKKKLEMNHKNSSKFKCVTKKNSYHLKETL